MYCLNCKKLIPASSNFCLYCGKQVTQIEAADDLQSVVEITRVPSFRGNFYTFHLFVDGRKVGKVQNGKTTRVEVPPGRHLVFVRLGSLSAGIELEIMPREVAKLLSGLSDGFLHGNIFLVRVLETERAA